MQVLEATVDDYLYNVDTLRTIIGILLERSGGSLRLTREMVEQSDAASGKMELFVELNATPDEFFVELSIRPQSTEVN